MKSIELTNGEVTEVTLNFKSLKVVKAYDVDLYHRFSKILQNKNFDIFLDSLTVIYVGYLCANVNKIMNKEKLYTEQEFEDIAPFDIKILNEVAGELIVPNQKK